MLEIHLPPPESLSPARLPLLTIALVLGLHCGRSGADEPVPATGRLGAIVDFTEENDAAVGTDRHYTQGARLAYLGGDDQMPAWVLNASQAIPALGLEVDACRLGFEVGQDIYTPENLAATSLIANDWPYAGWLYTGLVLQRRGATGASQIPVLENLRLDLGVIGPESLAEDAQVWFHRQWGEHWPQGWDHQLRTEPGFAARYQRAWRLAWQRGAQAIADFLPHAGLSLGNVDTSFRIGGMGRIGWNLPEDFGIQTIHSLAVPDGGRLLDDDHHPVGFYFFGGAEGSAVLYTTFLDGNLFSAGPHVTRVPFVGELQGGAALVLDRVEIAATLAFRTREFVGQAGNDGYGSLVMKYKF